ncbi:MAG: hypothetical protein HY316_09420, partial [Acidobacteria bacterium]|nr:hypothetical protein [Acidobacteriota bacterium]
MKSRIENLAAAGWQSMVEFLQRPFRIYQSRDCEGAVVPLTSEAMRVQMPAELRQVMCEDMRREMQRLLREELRQLLADPAIARSLRNPLVGTAFPFAAGMPTCTQYTIPMFNSASCSPLDLADSAIVQNSGNIGIGTNPPAVALDVSGTIRAVLSYSAPYGAYLIPTAGAANGFRFGLGNNLYFDGANWRTKGDGANNAGSAMLTDIGNGALQVFTLPSTGAPDQVVSNSSLATYERMRITNAGNVGIGTTSPDSKLDVRGSINKIVYLRPSGSNDDGTRINTEIGSLPSNGGIIMLMPGDWQINITINIAKSGVKLRGYGGCSPNGSAAVPLTKLQWAGSADGTVISADSPGTSTSDMIRDIELSDLAIDGTPAQGTNKALVGLLLDSVIHSRFRNVHVRDMKSSGSAGIKLTSSSGVCAWNLFEACSVVNASKCVVLDRESTGENSCHNIFVALSMLFLGTASTDAGIYLGDCDNNSFYRTYIFWESSQGYGVVVDVAQTRPFVKMVYSNGW